VAPLAVGQYLAFPERAAHWDLAFVFAAWISDFESPDLERQYAASFGVVLGPLVQVALGTLGESDYPFSMPLPSWSDDVGDMWCEEFLAAGAQILKRPALLSPSQIEGQVVMTSRQGAVDVTETINHVVELAEGLRPVEDVRVSGVGIRPKIDLILSGHAVEPEESARFMNSVQDIPADVMILPNAPDD
jgi:hypothetical protein